MLLEEGDELGKVEDELLHVYPRPQPPRVQGKRIALYDPKGHTKKVFEGMRVSANPFDPTAPKLDGLDLLVIGAGALDSTMQGALGGIYGYAERGGNVLIMEQQTWNKLSRAFCHFWAPEHPVFRGLDGGPAYFFAETGKK